MTALTRVKAAPLFLEEKRGPLLPVCSFNLVSCNGGCLSFYIVSDDAHRERVVDFWNYRRFFTN